MTEVFPSIAALKYLKSISGRIRRFSQRNETHSERIIESGKKFEKALGTLLHKAFPSAVQKSLELSLSNAPQCQIDNLIHIRLENINYIIEVEVKLQDIQIDSKNRWMARYPSGPEDVKEQVNKHLKALDALYRKQSCDIDLRFVVFVCTPTVETATEISNDYEGAELHLIPFSELLNRMAERFRLNTDGRVICLTESNAFFSFQERPITIDDTLMVSKLLSVADFARRISQDKRTLLNKMHRLEIEISGDGLLSAHQMQKIAREFGYELFFQEGAPDIVHLEEPITAKSLADALNLKLYKVNRMLMNMMIFPDSARYLVSLDDAIECCRRLGYPYEK